MKIKKAFAKRTLAFLLCFVMLFGSAPLNGIAQFDFSRLGALNIDFFPIKSFFGRISLPGLFCTKASADNVTSGTCGNNLTWEFDAETKTLTINGTGEMTGYNSYTYAPWYNYRDYISKLVLNDGITNISGNAFSKLENLKSVTMSETITSIGKSAFSDCIKLTSINIPKKVTEIGEQAFYNCNLDNITVTTGNSKYHSFCNCLIDTQKKELIVGSNNSVIPSDGSVTNICQSAFSYCTNLESIAIPDSVTKINSHTFRGCVSLTELSIGNGVTNIDRYAFYGCSKLKNITIPDSVTQIGESAFSDCTAIKNISIGNGVASIGKNAFYNCSALESITVSSENLDYQSAGNCLIKTNNKLLVLGCKNSIIPSDGSVTNIGSSSFSGCTKLVSITIPNGVTEIGSSAFKQCTGLIDIIIPDSVTSVGSKAFFNCNGVTTISVGSGVTNISEDAFFHCSGLESIFVNPDNTFYSSSGNCLIETEIKQLILGSSNSVIPSDGTVTSIKDDAFYSCSKLKNITIPGSVTQIGENAFSDCTAIKNISIGNGVTSIGKNAFYNCSALESITIPDSVTNLGSSAFYGCINLTDINIPENITSIEEKALNCSGSIMKTSSISMKNGNW